jgi:3-oxoadipate enol-lactonase
VPVARVGDVELYYELHGAGEPVVLIGGLGSDVSLVAPLAARLALGARVLAFDNRGAGRSSMPDVPYSVEMMAADTIGVMDAAGIGAADLVGISMGGRIALALTLAHPDRVRRLVLVSTGARTPQRVRISRPLRIAWLLRRVPPFRRAYPQPDYAYERQRAASRAYDCTARLGEISAPTLILHGRRDRMMPRTLVEELHDGIRGSKLVLFDGGHMFFVMRERGAFLDRVEAFVGRRPPDR